MSLANSANELFGDQTRRMHNTQYVRSDSLAVKVEIYLCLECVMYQASTMKQASHSVGLVRGARSLRIANIHVL